MSYIVLIKNVFMAYSLPVHTIPQSHQKQKKKLIACGAREASAGVGRVAAAERGVHHQRGAFTGVHTPVIARSQRESTRARERERRRRGRTAGRIREKNEKNQKKWVAQEGLLLARGASRSWLSSWLLCRWEVRTKRNMKHEACLATPSAPPAPSLPT